MRFAIFYEIPVPQPWGELDEYQAYQNVIEEAVLADEMGYDSFWTVEHHFLEEFSHCSNPEVLYGAVAARTKNIRLGYGVRLTPKPYNHPVRSAESAAVLDLVSNGRVEFGTGRSSTRAELEGFGIDPGETQEMWREAMGHIVRCWTEEETELKGKHWQMPKRRVVPKPLQKPHPPIWAATSSINTHRLVGELGLGLCSFAVGTPIEDLQERIKAYREGLTACKKPIGRFVNARVATFSMVCCAPSTDEALETATDSFEWYPAKGAELISSVAFWMQEKKKPLQTYGYLEEMKQLVAEGSHKLLTMDYLRAINACVVGDPEEVIGMCRAYEKAGVDLLLCLVNPYKIPHEKVMQTIELMGRHVLPVFREEEEARGKNAAAKS